MRSHGRRAIRAPWVDDYTQAYIRLLEQAKRCRVLPWALKSRIGAWCGSRGSFLLQRREQVVAAMQTGLALDDAHAEQQFRLLCKSTGVAAQMVWQLADISRSWLERHIQTPDAATLKEISATGAVILSHHSYHHNLLISFFKLCGLPLFPVGNPPAAFSDDDYLYHFTLRLNRATASNLNAGHWLFNDQGRDFLLGLRQALEPQRVLLVFCDFNEAKKSNPVLPFMGRTLQIPNGVLHFVEKTTVPVYFAGFRWQAPEGYVLSLTRLHTRGADAGAAPLGEQYLGALEQHIRRYPAAWQHWEELIK